VSLLDKAKAQVRDEAIKKLAMLEASAPAIAHCNRLAAALGARGWNPQTHVTADLIAGVQLQLWINVRTQQLRANLLEDIEALQIPCARSESLSQGDVYGYHLTISDNVRVRLRVGVPLAALAEAA
jgi:hypothetical protein